MTKGSLRDFKKLSDVLMRFSSRSLVAVEGLDVVSFSLADAMVVLRPVTLWKIRTCFSPLVNTYSPAESKRMRVITPEIFQLDKFHKQTNIGLKLCS